VERDPAGICALLVPIRAAWNHHHHSSSLSVRGLDAEQFGPAVLWTAVFELALAFIGGLLLYKGIDSRLLMAIGFSANCTTTPAG
jgi:hypothetical protein